jgi:tRNA U34 5-methylaminomethyl-2-thiouridine-forming methyltransferase MnmC
MLRAFTTLFALDFPPFLSDFFAISGILMEAKIPLVQVQMHMPDKNDSTINVNDLAIAVQRTGDGSTTLFLPHLDETYHSRHGAVQESRHVFIQAGLHAHSGSPITLLEVGFGTGLNALLTAADANERSRHVQYISLETVPLPEAVFSQLDFPGANDLALLQSLHAAPWETAASISPFFTLQKMNCRVQDVQLAEDSIDLIYYDAFGPRAQPDMWTPEIFASLFRLTKPGGMWVSYCSKGQVRRDLESVGWVTEKLPGPPGKREMMRATKPV